MSSVTPGRATDALVAEKLGWRSIHFERHGDHENAYGQPTPTSHDCTPVPRFSEVAADAISALEATGKHYTISKDDGCYHIQVWRDEEHQAQGDEFCTAPTLCLAACRAILQLPTPHPPEPA